MPRHSAQTLAASNSVAAPLIETNIKDHIAFFVVTILYWTTLYIYVPVLTPYLEGRGLSLQLIGFVLGSYGLVQIILRIPIGLASDKLRLRKPFIMLGFITGMASCVLFALPGSWLWPLAGRLVSGISASTWVAFTVLYASYFSSSHSTKAMGTISLMTVSGQLLGMALSGLLTEHYSYTYTFGAGVVVGLIGLVAAIAVKEPAGGVGREPFQLRQFNEVIRHASLIKASLLSIIAHSILFITMFGFTPLQATALGANSQQLTYVVFAFMVPHAIVAYASGKWIAPKFGLWNTIWVGFLLSGIFTALIPYVPSLGWLMATQAANGFTQGLYFPILLAMSIQGVEGPQRATAMGLYQAAYSIGMFAGPFLAGWLNGAGGLGAGFLFGGILGLAGAALAFYWRRDA